MWRLLLLEPGLTAHRAGGSEKAFTISLSVATYASDMPLTALGQWRCGAVAVFMYGLMHGPKGWRIPFFGLVAYSTGIYPAVLLVVFSTNHILIQHQLFIYHQVDPWWSS
jgi:hypothetical protein